jgi:hypothetical protein
MTDFYIVASARCSRLSMAVNSINTNPAKLPEIDSADVVLRLLRSDAGFTPSSGRRECLSYTKYYCRAQLRKLYKNWLTFNQFSSWYPAGTIHPGHSEVGRGRSCFKRMTYSGVPFCSIDKVQPYSPVCCGSASIDAFDDLTFVHAWL